MISTLRRNRYQAVFAWLALAAVLLRSVIPLGFMPVHATGHAHGLQLAMCHAHGAAPGLSAPDGSQLQADDCPFALAAMAAIPPAPPRLPHPVSIDGLQAGPLSASIVSGSIRTRPPARAPPLFS